MIVRKSYFLQNVLKLHLVVSTCIIVCKLFMEKICQLMNLTIAKKKKLKQFMGLLLLKPALFINDEDDDGYAIFSVSKIVAFMQYQIILFPNFHWLVIIV